MIHSFCRVVRPSQAPDTSSVCEWSGETASGHPEHGGGWLSESRMLEAQSPGLRGAEAGCRHSVLTERHRGLSYWNT